MTYMRLCASALVILAAAALAGCAGERPGTADSATPDHVPVAEVVVRAMDNVFHEAPDTIEAGLTNIRLINEGPMFHHVWLVRLEGGHTLHDLLAEFQAGNPPPSWITDIGGPNTPGAPGEETSAIVDLEPGTYALLCMIDLPDGVPHVMKGMSRELTVIPASGPAAALPEADIVMTLTDYAFGTDRPITAGTQTIRVVNAAAQPHEVLFVKLEAGRTVQEFMQFVMSPQGPPPGKVLGGTTGIAHEGMNQITLTFEPGEYGLICFIPDAGDGRPHFMHGMVQQIAVQ